MEYKYSEAVDGSMNPSSTIPSPQWSDHQSSASPLCSQHWPAPRKAKICMSRRRVLALVPIRLDSVGCERCCCWRYHLPSRWHLQANDEHPDHQEWHQDFAGHPPFVREEEGHHRRRRPSWVRACGLASADKDEHFADTCDRTPTGWMCPCPTKSECIIEIYLHNYLCSLMPQEPTDTLLSY
jgi:hypothetical protein